MTIEVEVIEKSEYTRVYYKRRWVLMLLPHVPHNSTVEVVHDEVRDRLLIDGSAVAGRDFSTIEVIDPGNLSKRELKELCEANNIPLSWATDRFSEDKCTGKTSNLRLEIGRRKIRPISAQDARRVFKALRSIDRKSELIAKILWHVNKGLRTSGSYVTLEGILRLKKCDLHCQEVGGVFYVCVEMMLFGRSGHSVIIHYLPPHIFKPMFKQMSLTSPFVFSNHNGGGPLHATQISADFQKAGNSVGLIDPVTSLSFRPPLDARKVARFSKKNIFSGIPRTLLKAVTQEEWDAYFVKVLYHYEKKGRKPIYKPIILFNAILHCLSTGSSMKKPVFPFLSASAVESQYRRWKKNGIFDQFFKILLAARSPNSTLT